MLLILWKVHLEPNSFIGTSRVDLFVSLLFLYYGVWNDDWGSVVVFRNWMAPLYFTLHLKLQFHYLEWGRWTLGFHKICCFNFLLKSYWWLLLSISIWFIIKHIWKIMKQFNFHGTAKHVMSIALLCLPTFFSAMQQWIIQKYMIFCASESCDCFCCSVDLRSLVEQNRPHFIPPTSRMTNYVVFRFGNLESDYNVSMSPCSFYLE